MNNMSGKNENFLITSLKNKVRTIRFNRPQRKNALPEAAYKRLADILNEDAKNDDVVLTIITGTGDFYSSGTELSFEDDEENNLEKRQLNFQNFVAAFINYPKLLIAVVNGPAIGIAVTTLALCDVVYASDKATFQTPFMKVGVSPEACSSLLFPLILGRSKASEMLFLGHKMTAEEAHQFGLISKVIPHRQLSKFIEDLHKYRSLSVNYVKNVKALINKNIIEKLHVVNNQECKLLFECFQSEEFIEKIMEFMNRKVKSKL